MGKKENLKKIDREFIKAALDAQMDTFFLFELDTGKAIKWNKAFREISGYADEEISMMPAPASYYGPDDLIRANEFTQMVLNKGTGTIELELITKDGQKVPFEYRVSVLNNDLGEPKRIISIGRDITERKMMEEKYHMLVEHSPSVLWKTSEKGKTAFISNNIKDYFGYSAEEIYEDGENKWIGRIHPEDLDRVLDSFNELFQTGKKFDVEYRIKRKDEKWIWLHDVANDVIVENGIKYAYGVFTDITESKKAEKEIIEQRNRSRFFLDLLTHDIGNIHQSLYGNVQLIKMTSDQKLIRSNVESMRKELIRSMTMTRNLKLLASINEKAFEPQYFYLKNSIDATIYKLKSRYPARDINVKLNIDPEIELLVDEYIDEVFFNLLENALKVQDEKDPIIEMETRRKDGFHEVIISDHGPGIIDEEKERVISRMDSDIGKYQRGIGLALVRTLMERYNGYISVHDRIKGDPTKGVSMILSFPLYSG